MIHGPSKGLKWYILPWWVLASTLGYSLGFPVALATGQSLLWGWLLGGGVASALQWVVLRRHLPRAGWWPVLSLAGLLVGSGLSFLVSRYIALTAGIDAAFASVGATVGLGAGAAQWIKLRLHCRNSGWWVPASTAGYTLGVLAAVNAPVAFPAAGALIFGPEFGGLVGVASGAVTGSLMVWLVGTNDNSQ